MQKLRVLCPDGSVTECDATFKACQEAVKGYVEVIHVADGVVLVNEDGLMRQMEKNPVASLLVGGRTVVGHAVLVPKKLMKKVLG